MIILQPCYSVAGGARATFQREQLRLVVPCRGLEGVEVNGRASSEGVRLAEGMGKNGIRGKTSTSPNTASTRPILLREYFRPSQADRRPFSRLGWFIAEDAGCRFNSSSGQTAFQPSSRDLPCMWWFGSFMK